jgi:hypothetical protein
MRRFPTTRFQQRFFRLSPLRREEDEGEGFERIRAGLTLTLTKGEATWFPHCCSTISVV